MKIKLWDFIDFALVTGPGRVAAAKAASAEEPPAGHDFYADLRKAIIDAHEKKQDHAATLGARLEEWKKKDERKGRIYPPLIDGYIKFLATLPMMTWALPPSLPLTHGLGDVEVDTSPDLGFWINGTLHFVTMYFNGEPLARKRISLVLNLLMMGARATAVVSLLDVKNVKLHTLRGPPSPKVALMFRGEAAALATIRAGMS